MSRGGKLTRGRAGAGTENRRSRTDEKGNKKEWNFYKKTGEFLVGLMKPDQPGKGTQRLQQELIALSGKGEKAVHEYYVKKLSLSLGVLAAGMVLSSICLAIYVCGGKDDSTQLLKRPGYGEGDRKERLTVQIEGEEKEQQLEITVQERKYTDQEKQELLDRAMQKLDTVLPGENKSLDEVRSDLCFPQSMEEGAVTVSWSTIPYGLIDEDGALHDPEDENGTLVEIQGTLNCSGKETVYIAYAKVFPPKLPEQERFRRTIRKEVERTDASESHEEELKLPESVEGKMLTWRKVSENPAPVVLALALILTIVVYLEMDNQVHRKAEERKNRLMLAYPDLMWKMTMLLGAGLSIKGTFSRIAQEYQKEQTGDSGKRKRLGAAGEEVHNCLYREVARTCYEMRSGVPEGQAYERFGRRCQLPEYIRLGSVLSQNLRKGTNGLTALLASEAEESLNERKNHARKIGERAGTKLLLPMILMLGIVLVILMVPAFLSF